MVNKKIMLFIFIIIATLIPAKAAEIKVIDNAALFTSEEKEKLEKRCDELSEKYDLDIAIATTDDTGDLNTMMFTEKFYEEKGYGSNGSGIIVMYDMKNREIFINTEGKAIEKINDDRVEKLLDAIFDNGLADGEYYRSAEAYLDKLEKNFRGNYISIIDLGISALGAAGVGCSFFAGKKLQYSNKTSPKPFAFINNAKTNFVGHEDDLINSRVVKRRIPKSPPPGAGGSGGSTTRTSSTGSGRTYGGGGRKF